MGQNQSSFRNTYYTTSKCNTAHNLIIVVFCLFQFNTHSISSILSVVSRLEKPEKFGFWFGVYIMAVGLSGMLNVNLLISFLNSLIVIKLGLSPLPDQPNPYSFVTFALAADIGYSYVANRYIKITIYILN